MDSAHKCLSPSFSQIIYCTDWKWLWIQPKPQFTHLRVDNALSSTAPACFTHCYLMLKAHSNVFELCVFPHTTLPWWTQLWQKAMKNPNQKLKWPNVDSGWVQLCICKITLDVTKFQQAQTEMQHVSFHQKHCRQISELPREFTWWKAII